MDDRSNSDARTEPGTAGDSRAEPGEAGHVRVDPEAEKISIDGALLLFEDAGVPRNKRSIRRYCKDGSMSCFKVDTEHGRQWMVDRVSAEKYIVQLQQALEFSQRTEVDTAGDSRAQPAKPGHDHLPVELQKTSEEVLFLREQVGKKDEQIASLLERDRETNVLIKGLQNMLLALTAPKSEEPSGTAGDGRQSTVYNVEDTSNPESEGEGGPAEKGDR